MYKTTLSQLFTSFLVSFQIFHLKCIALKLDLRRNALGSRTVFRSEDASLFEYTFMAIIVEESKNSSEIEELICEASIIHKDWVITAGTCFDEQIPNKNFQVYVGVIDLSVEVGQQKRQIKRIIVHPKYGPLNSEFNIAMIEVSNSFRITTHVNAGHLPSTPLSITGTERCHILGFAKEIDEDGSYQIRLKKTQLHVIDFKECLRRITILKSTVNLYMSEKNFCLVQIEDSRHDNTQGACKGATGGPCVCGYKLQGIIAHYTNETCHRFGYPTTIVDVGYHLDWIRRNVIQLNVLPKNLSIEKENDARLQFLSCFILLLINNQCLTN